MEHAKTDLHKAGFVRTPLPVYLKTSDWKRNPNARVDVESLKNVRDDAHHTERVAVITSGLLARGVN